MTTSSKENPRIIFDDIKKLLTIGVKDRKHGFHTPVFSNLYQDSSIESRIVVMRKFDSEKMIINFHTDFRSPKVNSLNKFNNTIESTPPLTANKYFLLLSIFSFLKKSLKYTSISFVFILQK